MKWTEKEFDFISSPCANDSERIIKRRVNVLFISKSGDMRIIRRFLFKPFCLNGIKKWLEFAKIIQRKIRVDMDIPYWESIKWTDNDFIPDEIDKTEIESIN